MARIRKSKALNKFLSMQDRCRDLTSLYIAIMRKKFEGKFVYSDILRAAIVLSVSSMDAYLTDRFCELVIPELKRRKPGKAMGSLLEKAGLDTRQALVLISVE